MKQTAILFLGLLSLSYSALLNASVCSSVIKTINRDINQSGTTIQTKRLPWMNIYWLKKRLGAPQVSNPHSSDETLLQYSWYCPENTELNMAVIANKEGLITEVHGQYSTEESAEYFSAVLPQNAAVPVAVAPTKAIAPLPPAITPPKPIVVSEPKPEEKNPEEDSLAKLLNPYNEYFQSSFKTKDELFTDMTNKIQTFYKNMRSCMPGIYRYAIYLQSGFIFPVSTIDGKKKGLCKVDTLFSVPTVGQVNAQCLYQAKNLTVYTDAEAESLIKGKSFDKAHPSLRDKVEAASCETYINGKLQPKLVTK